MSKLPKPDPVAPVPPASGVSEAASPYQAGPASEDWSIELARIEEYRRTGVTHDAEPILEAFLARVRARGEAGR